MLKHILLITGLLACAWGAHAQTPSAFVGKWSVKWEGDRRNQEAILIINESAGGTWQTLAKAKGANPCVGLRSPIEVETVSDQEIKVQIKFSDAIQGCENSVVHLRSADGKTLTGNRGNKDLNITRD